MGNEFLAFLSISLLLIVIPGPDMALVLRNALLGGRRGGVFTAFGIDAGLAVWTLATSAGVAALLVASEPAFVALKLAGAAYLVFLGVQALIGAVCAGGPTEASLGHALGPRLTPTAALRQGVVSNLGNPKIAVFFTSLLPQFTVGSGPSFAALLLPGLAFCALGFAWLTLYAVVVARAGDILRRPRIRRAIEGLTGTVLVAFGLRLATAHR